MNSSMQWEHLYDITFLYAHQQSFSNQTLMYNIVGEHQGIAQKGFTLLRPEKAVAEMATVLQEKQFSHSQAVNRSVCTPFCVILWGWLTLVQVRNLG